MTTAEYSEQSGGTVAQYGRPKALIIIIIIITVQVEDSTLVYLGKVGNNLGVGGHVNDKARRLQSTSRRLEANHESMNPSLLMLRYFTR